MFELDLFDGCCGGRDDQEALRPPGGTRSGKAQFVYAAETFKEQFKTAADDDPSPPRMVSVFLMERTQQRRLRHLARSNRGSCSLAAQDSSLVFWTCSRGHSWWATQDDVKEGKWCPRCGDQQPTRTLTIVLDMQQRELTSEAKKIALLEAVKGDLATALGVMDEDVIVENVGAVVAAAAAAAASAGASKQQATGTPRQEEQDEFIELDVRLASLCNSFAVAKTQETFDALCKGEAGAIKACKEVSKLADRPVHVISANARGRGAAGDRGGGGGGGGGSGDSDSEAGKEGGQMKPAGLRAGAIAGRSSAGSSRRVTRSSVPQMVRFGAED